MCMVTKQILNNYDDVEQSLHSIDRWLGAHNGEIVIERILTMCLARLEETKMLLEEFEPIQQQFFQNTLYALEQSIAEIQTSLP